MVRNVFAAVLMCLGLSAAAQQADSAKVSAPKSGTNSPNVSVTNAVRRLDRARNPDATVTMAGPGVFRIGSVQLNRDERSLTVPCLVNTNAGPMEYLLVQSRGKVHESILKTFAEPYHIHVAMLLLGAKAPTNNLAGVDSGGPIENPSSAKLEGDKISILVTWVQDGKTNSVPADKLVWNTERKASPESLAWIYNGSRMAANRFAAQLDGSIVSLITDPGAMVNHNSPGRENDQIWTVNTNNLPPLQAPLQVIFKLDP